MSTRTRAKTTRRRAASTSVQLAFGLGVLALLSACSSSGTTTDQTTSVPTPSAATQSIPSTTVTSSTSDPAGLAHCPHIVDTRAGLSWTCVADDLVTDTGDRNLNDQAFTTLLHRPGLPDWGLAEGSAPNYEPTDSALPDAAEQASNLMVSTEFGSGAQLPSKVTHTAAHPVRLGTVPGYEVDQVITLNPSYPQPQSEKITRELLTVVLAKVRGRYSLWFVSLPDTEQQLWSTVPALIRGLRVS